MINQSELRQCFVQAFGAEPQAWVFAPGRVNLMGEHTDYNQGLVLAAAISLGTQVVVAPRADQRWRCVWAQRPKEEAIWESSRLVAQDHEFDWSNPLRRLNECMVMAWGPLLGADIYIISDLPEAGHLAASFSQLMAVAAAVAHCNRLTVSKLDLSQVCLAAKEAMQPGWLPSTDAVVMAAAQAGQAVFIDCRKRSHRPVSLAPNLGFLLLDLQLPSGFMGSALFQRRQQCEMAAKALGLASLRDITEQDLLRAKTSLDELLYRRAQHVFSENKRCFQLADALMQGDLARVSALMQESQASLKEAFDVTTAAIDDAVARVQRLCPWPLGVRLTGGGFGGSLVVVAEQAHILGIQACLKAASSGASGQSLRCLAVTSSSVSGPMVWPSA